MDNWKDINIKNFNFNARDMLILIAIFYEKNKSSVAQIRKKIDIAPNNLTAHLKKLEDMKIIIVKDNGIGKVKEISMNFENRKYYCLIQGVMDFFLFDNYSKEQKKKIEEERKENLEMMESLLKK